MANDLPPDLHGEPLALLPGEVAQRFGLWAAALGPLIRLHDREPDQALIDSLWQADFPAILAALLEGRDEGDTAQGFARVLAGLPRPLPAAVLDELAADFADAYLNHGFRAAPTGSVWMTEDHLERQEPMLAVRSFYEYYRLTVPDWRLRSDDHIVHEMQFVVHLLGLGTLPAVQDAALFMDQHLLPWGPEFCLRVATRARHPFLAGVGLITRSLLLALRNDIAETTGIAPAILPHAWATEGERAVRQAKADEESPFVPGTSESW